MSKSVRNTLAAYLLLLPALVLFSVFILIPLGYEFMISLSKWNGFGPMSFVGLRNYTRLFSDPEFYAALSHNVQYAFGTVLVKIVLSFVLALLLHGAFRGVTLFRTIMFIPVVLSFVVVGILWQWIFNPNFGLMNVMLGWLGLNEEMNPIQWLGSPHYALIALMMVDVWKWTGYHAIIFLAGLQGIPKDIYEAASVDGATRWRSLWHVTVPLMRPTLLLNVTIAAMGAFNVFDIVYTMTQGGPYKSTSVLLTMMYDKAFGSSSDYGYGTSIAFALFVIIVIISAIHIRIVNRSERA